MTLIASNGSYTLDLTLHNIHKDPVVVEASSAVPPVPLGLDWTGHMSFLTRQDRTPKFA